jgi:hypothetical protein
MSKIHGRSRFLAVLSSLSIAALSNGLAKAADDVTEDQILKALAPAKKPLTRSLSAVPQTQVDPAAAAAEGKFVQSLRNRSTRRRHRPRHRRIRQDQVEGPRQFAGRSESARSGRQHARQGRRPQVSEAYRGRTVR